MIVGNKNLSFFLLLLIILEYHPTSLTMYSFKRSKDTFLQFNRRNPETVLTIPRMELSPTACKMKKFNLTITRKGCQPQTVTNNFCYGVCHSFYIPSDREVEKVQDVCVPTNTVKQHITLICRRKRKPGIRTKRLEVTKVLDCGCSRI